MEPASKKSRNNTSGFLRTRAKLRLALDKENYYEAHQLYRTLYFRLLGQRKYRDIEELIYSGANLLFEKGQDGSVVDLIKLYMEVMKASREDQKANSHENSRSDYILPTDEILQRLSDLFSLVPSENAERSAILTKIVNWSASFSEHPFGDPRLHQLLAYSLWKSQKYSEARHHFLHSLDGPGCGAMLAEFHSSKGYRNEIDLFVTGTVLQYICLKKHVVAALALKSYTDNHPSIKKGPPYASPLLNFVWLLLLAIETKQSLQTFSILFEKYKNVLDRDVSFIKYVDKIGQNFFGLPAPQAPANRGGMGMFSGMFDSLFTGLNDDAITAAPSSTTTTTTTTTTTKKTLNSEDLD